MFVAGSGLSLVAASGATLRCGARASHCSGLPCCKHLDCSSCRIRDPCLWLMGPGCSSAWGIFPDQGSKPWPLHWQTTRPPGKPLWPFFKLLWVILERRNLVIGTSRGISHLPRTIWVGSQHGEDDLAFRNSAFTKSLLSTYWWPQSLCNVSETKMDSLPSVRSCSLCGDKDINR